MFVFDRKNKYYGGKYERKYNTQKPKIERCEDETLVKGCLSLSEVFVHDVHSYFYSRYVPSRYSIFITITCTILESPLFIFYILLPPYFYPASSYSYFTTTSPSFKSFLLRRRNGNPFHIKVFSIEFHDCTFVRKGTKTPFSTVVAMPTRTNPSER